MIWLRAHLANWLCEEIELYERDLSYFDHEYERTSQTLAA